MTHHRKVSVIMGVYNCAETLENAVASIQSQTYSNWEMIICDDGSFDNTYEKAREICEKDGRIKVIRNDKNLGLGTALNRCISFANGDYIARMDGDDDCLAGRFEKQVAFLEAHPEFAIVSTPMVLFDETGEWGRTYAKEYPQPKDIVCGSPICHAPVMMRKECLEAVGGYAEEPWACRVEDVNLWIKLYAAGYRCYNFPDPLYRMRNNRDAFNRRKYRYRVNSTYVRLKGCKALGLGFSCRLWSLRPLLHGLIPWKLRQWIRKKQKMDE